MYRQGMNITHMHVFVNGEGREFEFNVLDVEEHPTEAQLKTACEIYLNLESGLLRNFQVEGYEASGLVVLRPDSVLGKEDEYTVRARIFDSLINCPHREMGDVLALHELMCEEDPEFYAHMAVWAMKNTKVRDHKEAFLTVLFGSKHALLRDTAFAMIQDFPAYQVARIRSHMAGAWKALEIRVKKDSSAPEKKRAVELKLLKKALIEVHEANGDLTNILDKVRTFFKLNKDVQVRTRFYRQKGKNKEGAWTKFNRVKIEAFQKGLRKKAPKDMKEAVRVFLKRLEGSKSFDYVCVRQFNALKDLYASFHIAPSTLADLVLFKDTPPEGTMRYEMKAIAKLRDPLEWATRVVAADIPFSIAAGLSPIKLTPVHLVALINQMSAQELLNNLGALEERGAMENAEVKTLINTKLKKAKTSDKVDALKAQKAVQVLGEKLSSDVVENLTQVTDAQVSRTVAIKRRTILAIDASSSMDQAIGVGKELGAIIAPSCKSDFACVSFNDMAREHKVTDPDKKSSWDAALQLVRAQGRTNMGSVVKFMEMSGVAWEQVILVTDEGDNGTPKFSAALKAYRDLKNLSVNVVIVRLKSNERWSRVSDEVEKGLKHYDFETDVFDLTKADKIDYYSLPNILPMLAKGSRLELLMSIMTIPLPSKDKYLN